MSKFSLVVAGLYADKRIDTYLVGALEGKYSRSQVKKAFDAGTVILNGVAAKPRTLVTNGDRIEASIELPILWAGAEAEDLPIKIIFEDESVAVIEKPVGMVVHPGAGNRTGTLVNALLGRALKLSSVGGSFRPGIVHRLDKDTSGLLVIAKTNTAHKKLQTQFSDRSLTRTYVALVEGIVEYEEGRILKSIGRHPKMRERMAVSELESAREADTRYRVVKRYKQYTLLEVNLKTGRTHQIRVHMQHLGHPVVGDPTYGTIREGIRLCLHAAKIRFVHPKSGKIMEFESPIPADIQKCLEMAADGSL